MKVAIKEHFQPTTPILLEILRLEKYTYIRKMTLMKRGKNMPCKLQKALFCWDK